MKVEGNKRAKALPFLVGNQPIITKSEQTQKLQYRVTITEIQRQGRGACLARQWSTSKTSDLRVESLSPILSVKST